jgi:hypothetical protein
VYIKNAHLGPEKNGHFLSGTKTGFLLEKSTFLSFRALKRWVFKKENFRQVQISSISSKNAFAEKKGGGKGQKPWPVRGAIIPIILLFTYFLLAPVN